MQQQNTIQPKQNTIQPIGMTQDFRDKQMRKKYLGIAIGVVVLVGLGLTAKKYPKATFGTIGALFIYAYFFVGFWGPSRYQRWKNGKPTEKLTTAIK